MKMIFLLLAVLLTPASEVQRLLKNANLTKKELSNEQIRDFASQMKPKILKDQGIASEKSPETSITNYKETEKKTSKLKNLPIAMLKFVAGDLTDNDTDNFAGAFRNPKLKREYTEEEQQFKAALRTENEKTYLPGFADPCCTKFNDAMVTVNAEREAMELRFPRILPAYQIQFTTLPFYFTYKSRKYVLSAQEFFSIIPNIVYLVYLPEAFVEETDYYIGLLFKFADEAGDDVKTGAMLLGEESITAYTQPWRSYVSIPKGTHSGPTKKLDRKIDKIFKRDLQNIEYFDRLYKFAKDKILTTS